MTSKGQPLQMVGPEVSVIRKFYYTKDSQKN